eukprot:NODE_367_length_1015_cov_954.115942_g287_i0.p1 GENE.NODE_367_length_1015_cov_954.115942_g287_i0~~NODE_367_length_1015_cov_954.115942_g287_i0.p1  ORF type:complete len:235 (-),score=21.40 NODE_367_length_1015_cov_954.115942_g287_i0:198-902(-)
MSQQVYELTNKYEEHTREVLLLRQQLKQDSQMEEVREHTRLDREIATLRRANETYAEDIGLLKKQLCNVRTASPTQLPDKDLCLNYFQRFVTFHEGRQRKQRKANIASQLSTQSARYLLARYADRWADRTLPTQGQVQRIKTRCGSIRQQMAESLEKQASEAMADIYLSRWLYYTVGRRQRERLAVAFQQWSERLLLGSYFWHLLRVVWRRRTLYRRRAMPDIPMRRATRCFSR